MFFPLIKKSWPVILVSKKLSMSNTRAQEGLIKAFLSNNPSYGLINSWSELESQVGDQIDLDFKQSKNKQIIEACSEKLCLSKSNRNRLRRISQKRNGVAHAIGEYSPPNWNDVLFVLRVSKKYRKRNEYDTKYDD